MSAIISIGLKKEDLKNIPDTKGYINLTLFVDDEIKKFGNNVSVTVSQTKDQRDSKEKKTYVGNGKVIFVRDGIKTAKQLEAEAPQESDSGDPW